MYYAFSEGKKKKISRAAGPLKLCCLDALRFRKREAPEFKIRENFP